MMGAKSGGSGTSRRMRLTEWGTVEGVASVIEKKASSVESLTTRAPATEGRYDGDSSTDLAHGRDWKKVSVSVGISGVTRGSSWSDILALDKLQDGVAIEAVGRSSASSPGPKSSGWQTRLLTAPVPRICRPMPCYCRQLRYPGCGLGLGLAEFRCTEPRLAIDWLPAYRNRGIVAQTSGAPSETTEYLRLGFVSAVQQRMTRLQDDGPLSSEVWMLDGSVSARDHSLQRMGAPELGKEQIRPGPGRSSSS